MHVTLTWRIPTAFADHECNPLWEYSVPVEQVFIQQNGDIQITPEGEYLPISFLIPSTWVEDLIYVD